jgi:hypothetical protein
MRAGRFGHLYIIVTACFFLAHTAMASEELEALTVDRYLQSHPTLRRATTNDCGDCADDVARLRAGDPPEWPAVADYDPYLLQADFNGDGQLDVAVVLIDTMRAKNAFVLAIFNGPLRLNDGRPNFLKRGLDLRGGGLFYGPPRPRPYRLVVGKFESEGAIVEPVGRTYRWRD